ncbi:MAG: hypothetical protein AAF745_15455 [Planctomycetota bacterium]
MTESFHVHCYGPSELDSGELSKRTHPAIPTSFEAALERLQRLLPQVLFEPDGSLAWASPSHQVVGMVYDAQTTIQYVELRGHCDGQQFIELVRTLAGTDDVGSYQLMLLPQRQWKDLQTFAKTLPGGVNSNPAESRD